MSRPVLALLSCLLLLSTLSACEPERERIVATTQVSLRVDASEEIREQVSELRAALAMREGGDYEERSRVTIPIAAVRWPLELPIVMRRMADQDAELEVVVRAYRGEMMLAETRVLTHFVLGKHTWIEAPPLERCAVACAPDACHGASCQVCADSLCTPVVPRSPVDVLSDGGELPATRDGGIADAGVMVSPADAAAPARDASLDGRVSSDAGGAAPDAPSPDASLAVDPATADAAAQDASASDGQIAGDAGSLVPRSCPVDHGCKAPYACEPTALGYICRGQFADWPMPDALPGAKVAPSYSSSGDTVVDNVTKLEWQIGVPPVYAGCSQIDDPIVGNMQPGELCTRAEARAYCGGLVHGGKDDWRLPSVIELASLFDTGRPTSRVGINSAVFGDVESWAFVTDSLYASGPSTIWGINFYARVTHPIGAYYGKVRCVRGGAEPPFADPSQRYAIDATAGTVTDRATGLIWQRSVSTTLYEEAQLAARCVDGYRLPTPNELLTLVDFTRAMPAIDPVAFPDTPSGPFWASASSAAKNGVDFGTGELTDHVSSAHVRCVR